MKVRNTAYLTDSTTQDESNRGPSSNDTPVIEQICLTTRVITYLGAVSFFKDTNTAENCNGRAFLGDKEPAFSFLLVLTKSECPCILKIESTSSGYVITKEQYEGTIDEEPMPNGENSDKDGCEEMATTESNQNQDKQIDKSEDIVEGIIKEDVRQESVSKRKQEKDRFKRNKAKIKSSKAGKQNQDKVKDVSSLKNPNYEEAEQIGLSKDNNHTVELEVSVSENELDNEEEGYSSNFSLNDQTSHQKKQETRTVKRIKLKHFCIFCKKMVGEYARHLRRRHKDEKQIQKLLELDKSDKIGSGEEKKALLDKLRSEGTCYHNMQILKTGSNVDIASNLILKRRTKRKINIFDLVQCKYCKNVYQSTKFFRHVDKCDFFKRVGGKSCNVGRKSIIKQHGQRFYPQMEGASKEFKDKILPFLNLDESAREAFSDKLIMSVVSRFLEIHKDKNYRHSISRKLREGGKLMLNLKKKDSTIKELKECFSPSKIDLVANTVTEMCTSSQKNGPINYPLLWIIKKGAAKLLEDVMLDEESSSEVRLSSKQNINKFLVLFHRKIKSLDIRNSQQSKSNQRNAQKTSMQQNETNTNPQKSSNKQSQVYKSISDTNTGAQTSVADANRFIFEVSPHLFDSSDKPCQAVPSDASAENSNTKCAESQLQTDSSAMVGSRSVEVSSVESEDRIQSSLLIEEVPSENAQFNPVSAMHSLRKEPCSLTVHNRMEELHKRRETNDVLQDQGKICSELERNDDILPDSTRSVKALVKTSKLSSNQDHVEANCVEELITYGLDEQLDSIQDELENGGLSQNLDLSSLSSQPAKLQSRTGSYNVITETKESENLEEKNWQSESDVELPETDILEDLVNYFKQPASNETLLLEGYTGQILDATEGLEDSAENTNTQYKNVDFVNSSEIHEESNEKEKNNTGSTLGVTNDINIEQSKDLGKPKLATKLIVGEHYCIFCKYLIRNFRKHVLQNHKQEEQIIHYFKLFREDKESTHQERSKILEDLCNEGDRIYTEIIIENPSMEYVLTCGLPVKQPPAKRRPSQDTYKMCKRCKSLLSQEEYSNHICGKNADLSENTDEDDFEKWIPKCKVVKTSHPNKTSKSKLQIKSPTLEENSESQPVVRKRWSDEEKSIVINEFKEFIMNGTNPGTNRCRDLILKHKVLSGRTNLQLNIMIDNINRGKLKLPEEFQYLRSRK